MAEKSRVVVGTDGAIDDFPCFALEKRGGGSDGGSAVDALFVALEKRSDDGAVAHEKMSLNEGEDGALDSFVALEKTSAASAGALNVFGQGALDLFAFIQM